MSRPFDPTYDKAVPRPANDEPAKVIEHPATAGMEAAIDKALERPPHSGEVGRIELFRHWDQLSPANRQLLLLLARQLLKKDQV